MSPSDKPKFAQVSLASVDVPTLVVHAQYNPGTIEIGKDIPWSPTSQANNENQNGLHLEFTGAKGRTTSLELLFDGFEDGGKVRGGKKVAEIVADLEKLASVIVPGSTKEHERRPHLCVAVWGDTLKSFRCVITSVKTKYTMFSESGTPLRATCTIALTEADVVSVSKALSEPATPPAQPSPTPTTPRGGS